MTIPLDLVIDGLCGRKLSTSRGRLGIPNSWTKLEVGVHLLAEVGVDGGVVNVQVASGWADLFGDPIRDVDLVDASGGTGEDTLVCFESIQQRCFTMQLEN